MAARWLGALVLAVVSWRAAPVFACSLPAVEEHVIDPMPDDTTPPDALEEPSYTIARGNDHEVEEADGCGQRGVSSCAGFGRITFSVGAPAAEADGDAESDPPERLGYRIELVTGQAPEGLLPATPVVASDDGTITLFFHDGDGENQEMVSFTVAISAVDAAGNAGEPTELHVFDEGTSGGCRMAGGFASSWLPSALLTLAGLMAARRALRRRAPAAY